MNIPELINENLINNLATKFDYLLIEGLKRKGFVFADQEQTFNFVKENCKCEDYKEKQERIYFVNDIPFFLHNYKIDIPEVKNINSNITLTANYGSYAFL